VACGCETADRAIDGLYGKCRSERDVPKNSPAVGRPNSVTSNNNFRAIFKPRLIW
jgi:hypothetical protein